MKKILVFASMVLALAACQKSGDKKEISHSDIPIRLSVGFDTKATDTTFEEGDQIGVFVSYSASLEATGAYVANKKFTYSSGFWSSEQDIYWKDKVTNANFYVYSPYTGVSSAAALNFAVKTDQSSLTNYKTSDFLWGKKVSVSPTEDVVALSTRHLMSNLIVSLSPGEGFTEDEFAAATKSVSLGNIKTASDINLGTGEVTVKGDASSVTPYNNGEYWRTVVIPQTVTDQTALVSVVVNGVSYSLARNFTFRSGIQHKMNVAVNKLTNGLTVSIEDWTQDDQEYNEIAR